MLLLRPICLLVSLASAAVVNKPNTSVSTSTGQICQTKYSSVYQRWVPTATKTSSRLSTVTRTVRTTPTKTITPAPSTLTVSKQTTTTFTQTAPQLVNTTTTTLTASTTLTMIQTISMTNTASATTTVTTISSGTSTVPTSSGFTPVASLPSVIENGGGSRNGNPVSKRDADADANTQTPKNNSPKKIFNNKNGFKCKARYPICVDCQKNIDVYFYTTTTVTASTTSTVTAANPPASTTTATQIISTTTTITPAAITSTASTTTTSTSTSTILTTTTFSITTTLATTTTSFQPIGTVYAACGANNLIDAVGSTTITDLTRPKTGNFIGVSSASSPELCCQACMQTQGCVGFGFDPVYFGGCLLSTRSDGVCDATQQEWSFDDDAEGQVTVGNGGCGQGKFVVV